MVIGHPFRPRGESDIALVSADILDMAVPRVDEMTMADRRVVMSAILFMIAQVSWTDSNNSFRKTLLLEKV